MLRPAVVAAALGTLVGACSQPRASKGTFDHAGFMAVFKQQDHYDAIKSCYDRGLKQDRELRGARLDVTVGVGDTGAVRSVGIDGPPEFDPVSNCIRATVRSWRFPSTGESYEATFTMLLHAEVK